MVSLGVFFLYSTVSAAKIDRFTYFSSSLVSFYLFSSDCYGYNFLILCWIKVVRLDILVLFLISDEILPVFHLWILCKLWSWIYDLYYVEIRPSIPTFWWIFTINACWILSKSLFFIYWDDHMAFNIQVFNVVYQRYWFANTGNTVSMQLN